MAGTTGFEPATSDVTGLRSGSAESAIYLCFQRPKGDKLRHGSPLNASERYLHFTPTSRPFRDRCGIERKPAPSLKQFGSLSLLSVRINFRWDIDSLVQPKYRTLELPSTLGFRRDALLSRSGECFVILIHRYVPRNPGLLG